MTEYRTTGRRKMLDYLMENRNSTVSAGDIGRHMKAQGCPVNITTIYRYLDKLEKDGNVIRYVSEKGENAVYQYVTADRDCEEHLHLKCTLCGNISHLDCGFMSEIVDHMERDHGFTLQCKNSVIYGMCSNCRRTRNKKKD
ncbi:MAG: Fur family transcriptional regulator [Emergencia sp.]